MNKTRTDEERLNWLDHLGDIGRIRIDPDLPAAPWMFIVWNQWNVNLKDKTNKPSNIREAIDLAMEQELEHYNLLENS